MINPYNEFLKSIERMNTTLVERLDMIIQRLDTLIENEKNDGLDNPVV